MGAQGRDVLNQDDVFAALEKIHREKYTRGGGGAAGEFEEQMIPPLMRRNIAVYEAAKAMIGFITPNYDEISKVRMELNTSAILRVHGSARASR